MATPDPVPYVGEHAKPEAAPPVKAAEPAKPALVPVPAAPPKAAEPPPPPAPPAAAPPPPPPPPVVEKPPPVVVEKPPPPPAPKADPPKAAEPEKAEPVLYAEPAHKGSKIDPHSTRGGDTNSGGFENTVQQPPHISTVTPGQSNSGGYENRVTLNG
jgi:hypothetical protein